MTEKKVSKLITFDRLYDGIKKHVERKYGREGSNGEQKGVIGFK